MAEFLRIMRRTSSFHTQSLEEVIVGNDGVIYHTVYAHESLMTPAHLGQQVAVRPKVAYVNMSTDRRGELWGLTLDKVHRDSVCLA